MLPWIIVAFLAGVVAALLYASRVGRKNIGLSRAVFRRSAVLGLYCARIRRGEDDPDLSGVEYQADYLADHLYPAADGE